MISGRINVKIIVEHGGISAIFCDERRLPINFEIVDINAQYHDYDKLVEYEDAIRKSRLYSRAFETYAAFQDNERPESILERSAGL